MAVEATKSQRKEHGRAFLVVLADHFVLFVVFLPRFASLLELWEPLEATLPLCPVVLEDALSC